MKKIYCIKSGFSECSDFVEEFDNEEKFKEELLDIINYGGMIGKVYIEEKPDSYECCLKM